MLIMVQFCFLTSWVQRNICYNCELFSKLSSSLDFSRSDTDLQKSINFGSTCSLLFSCPKNHKKQGHDHHMIQVRNEWCLFGGNPMITSEVRWSEWVCRCRVVRWSEWVCRCRMVRWVCGCAGGWLLFSYWY
jgi:hypothetical protein